MKTSKNGIDLITHYEGGIQQHAYPDPRTNGEPYTIGIGHTGSVDGVKVHPGMVITPAKATQILQQDLAKFEADVTQLVKVVLTQGQFDALVSFAFNVGPDMNHNGIAEGLGDSTLLKYVNSKQFGLAAAEFIEWNKSKGKVMNGLTCRRMSERDLFSTGKLVLYRYDEKTKKICKI